MGTIEKKLVEKRFANSFGSYHEQALVQQGIAKRLADMIVRARQNLSMERVYEVGCGTGFLTRELIRQHPITDYYLNDLVASAYDEVLVHTSGSRFDRFTFLPGDAEEIPLPGSLDALVSSSTFQWFHDLGLFFAKAGTALNANGLLAFSTFGRDNYMEIRETLGVSLPYKSMDELAGIVQGDFELVCAEEWREEVPFSSPMEVLRHMKLTGVNGVSTCSLNRRTLRTWDGKYRKMFEKDNQVHLTYHPVIIIARKKDGNK